MNILKIVLSNILFIGITSLAYGQKIDSLNNISPVQGELIIKKTSSHSPQKAMIYEMVLPGLGHAYNKKLWHIPITYAAFATSIFFIIDNTKKYHKYRDAYADFSVYKRYLEAAPQYPIPSEEPKQQRFRKVLDTEYQTYSSTQLEYFQNALKRNKDQFKKYRDLSYILTGAAYIFNIIWAVVDAHFFDYDISDDLSLHIQPQIHIAPYMENTLALNLVFSF